MEEEGEILEPYELHYSDLISLSVSSPSTTAVNQGDKERLEAVRRAIMEALGPTGPGLLAITGVPNASNLRHTLLPLARNLALLKNDDRKRILKDHGLGSDVPLKNLDRSVSSFAMQLKYGTNLKSSSLSCGNSNDSEKPCKREDSSTAHTTKKLTDNNFKDLGDSFRKLGLCMMDLGVHVARICDSVLGGKELEQSLLESGSAKGRLIHYHSALDTRIIKESGGRKGSKKVQTNSKSDDFGSMEKVDDCRRSYEKHSNLWQEWHYDYGTFTVLTSPMFMRPRCIETVNGDNDCVKCYRLDSPSPSGHTYLQIFHPYKNIICLIKAPTESFILQVGESADILSKRKLQSTLHSVSRPTNIEDLSRETFVVFLHPAWNKVFSISDYPIEAYEKNGGQAKDDKNENKKLTQEIHRIIPPLTSRLKDGMTFADFSSETTRQYYGGNGLQSNR